MKQYFITSLVFVGSKGIQSNFYVGKITLLKDGTVYNKYEKDHLKFQVLGMLSLFQIRTYSRYKYVIKVLHML